MSIIQKKINEMPYIFLSDNVRDYLSQQFRPFMASHSIIYQTLWPHTFQQNGVVEHKKRLLIETT